MGDVYLPTVKFVFQFVPDAELRKKIFEKLLAFILGFHRFDISLFREMFAGFLFVGLICKSDGIVIVIYKIKCHYFLYSCV